MDFWFHSGKFSVYLTLVQSPNVNFSGPLYYMNREKHTSVTRRNTYTRLNNNISSKTIIIKTIKIIIITLMIGELNFDL